MTHEPVDTGHTPEKQIVMLRDLHVDHDEPVGRVDSEEIDFSIWHARDGRVNGSQVRFERALAFSESDAQFLPRNRFACAKYRSTSANLGPGIGSRHRSFHHGRALTFLCVSRQKEM
jgi:hypothetical protein